MESDPTNLARFHEAQAGVYDQALAELTDGRKRSHWMWFVLPQLRGLGRSHRATFYGLADLDEARRYLADPVLGGRLRTCVAAILQHRTERAEDILGPIDALKFQSCLTVFEAAAAGHDDRSLFADGLKAFFDDGRDARTLAMLKADQRDGKTDSIDRQQETK